MFQINLSKILTLFLLFTVINCIQIAQFKQSDFDPNGPSLISIVQTYSFCYFNQSVIGLPYPEYIKFSQNNNQIAFQFRNLSNQLQSKQPPAPKLTIVLNKNFSSQCQAGLAKIYYFGCLPYWPDYQIIIVCKNNTHQMMSTLQVYASGENQISYGDVIVKPQPQLLYYEDSELYITNNIYQTVPTLTKFYFRRSTTPSSIKAPAYYKKYTPMQKRAKIVQIENILQKNTELVNFNILDRIFGIGENRTYDAYVTNNSELIIVRGSTNEVKFIWKPEKQQKIYKITKLCWSYTLAVLVEGYGTFVYFLQFQPNPDNLNLSLRNVRKSPSILSGVENAKQCKFFNVGKYVICQIYQYDNTSYVSKQKYNLNSTDQEKKGTVIETQWHVLWAEGININVKIQKFQRQVNIYKSEDLCSTNQFYQNNKKYQISSEYFQFASNKLDNKLEINYKLVSLQLTNITGTIVTYTQRFNDVPGKQIFLITKPQDQVISYYSCETGKCRNLLKSPYQILMSPQIMLVQANPNIKNITHQIHTMAPCVDPSNNLRPTALYTISHVSSNFYPTIVKTVSLPLSVNNFSLLTTSYDYILDSYTTTYIGKTSIQKTVFSQILPLSNQNTINKVKYLYQFDSDGFGQCVIRSSTQTWGMQQSLKILLYRIDNQYTIQKNNGLVIKQVGYQFNKSYILQDVKYFSQYANQQYKVSCTQFGLLVYSITEQHIVLYSSDLKIIYDFNEKFQNIKIGKDLLLTEYKGTITVRKIKTFNTGTAPQIIDTITNIKLKDIVLDLRSSGMIDISQKIYYAYVQAQI